MPFAVAVIGAMTHRWEAFAKMMMMSSRFQYAVSMKEEMRRIYGQREGGGGASGQALVVGSDECGRGNGK